MRRLTALSPLVVALALASCQDQTVTSPSLAPSAASFAQSASNLTLHPRGFGEKSLTAWRAKEGLPDSRGTANQALYFQKFTATSTYAAGVALIQGASGIPISEITGLSWEHRNDGHCGAGAPRWTFYVQDAGGNQGVVFLGCAAAAHTPGSAPNWTRDSYPGSAIAAAIIPLGSNPVDASTATLASDLAIVFDEGTDQGVGYVYLDNITVERNGTPRVFTSAADNGQ